MVNLDGMLSLGLTFWVVSIVNDISNVEITESWAANNELCFNGIITNKCAKNVTDGWKIHLKSSQPLSTLTSSDATILQTDGSSSFIFENVLWNRECLTGQTIQLPFSGCTPQNDTLPKMTIEFHRNENPCPKITPPKDHESIKISTVLLRDDSSSFQASLSITLPVTVQGNWVIYLAVSTQLSKLNAAGVQCIPSQGDIFTLTNLHWQEMFMAGVTYVLEIDGTKAAQGVQNPCIAAVFAWKKDMVVYLSTISPLSYRNQTTTQTVQQTFTRTSSQVIQFPTSSISQIRYTSSAGISTLTEPLQTMTSFETNSKIYQTNIQSSPTIYTQPTSTTTRVDVGDTILPHECGDVTVPSGFHYLETSVRVITDWPQGFSGEISFNLTTNVRDGWRIELVMSKSISLLNVYTVTANGSGTRFTLHNKEYNNQLESGSNVVINFDTIKERENENVPCIRAVFMWAMEKPCPAINVTSGVNAVNASVNITSQWNAGIAGEITAVVPAEIQTGWEIALLFDIPLTLTVYDAILSTPSTGTHFTLRNQSYNSRLQSGHVLVLAFTATKQETGATVLCTDAIFTW